MGRHRSVRTKTRDTDLCVVGAVRAAIAAVALSGCASHPKMTVGAPLEVNRGYWLDWTRFSQDGQQVDRGDVKDKLSEFMESAGDVQKGHVLQISSRVALAASLLLFSYGTNLAIERKTFWPLFACSGGGVGLSIGLGFAAEGKYVDAVEQYNTSQVGLSDLDW